MAVFQPRDQDVMYMAKQNYKNKFLIEVLEGEEPLTGEEDRSS